MTDEELFQAAQENKSEMGEHEKEEAKKAAVYAGMVVSIVCIIIAIVKLIAHKIDFSEYTIMSTLAATLGFYEGRKTGSKKLILMGIVGAAFTVIFLLLFIGAMLS